MTEETRENDVLDLRITNKEETVRNVKAVVALAAVTMRLWNSGPREEGA